MSIDRIAFVSMMSNAFPLSTKVTRLTVFPSNLNDPRECLDVISAADSLVESGLLHWFDFIQMGARIIIVESVLSAFSRHAYRTLV